MEAPKPFLIADDPTSLESYFTAVLAFELWAARIPSAGRPLGLIQSSNIEPPAEPEKLSRQRRRYLARKARKGRG